MLHRLKFEKNIYEVTTLSGICQEPNQFIMNLQKNIIHGLAGLFPLTRCSGGTLTPYQVQTFSSMMNLFQGQFNGQIKNLKNSLKCHIEFRSANLTICQHSYQFVYTKWSEDTSNNFSCYYAGYKFQIIDFLPSFKQF